MTCLRCERFLGTVPQALPAQLSKTCCTASALTGEQPAGGTVVDLQLKPGGSNEIIYRN